MSKVIHLSNEAHAKAKEFCKENSLRMSDWVAALIDEAIARGHTDVLRAPVARKKPLKRVEEARSVAPAPLAPPVAAAPAVRVAPPVVARIAPQQMAAAAPVAPVEPREEEVPAYAMPPFWASRG